MRWRTSWLLLAALFLAGCADSKTPSGTPVPPAPSSARPATPSAAPTLVLPPRPSTSAVVPGPSPSSRAAASYEFPIVGCRATYGRSHHDYPATDIFAPAGCRVVSVTSGTVDEVSRTDTWDSRENDGATRGGLIVSVIGDDGVRYYYSHFTVVSRGVDPGRRVTAGQQIGTVGTTGSARGTPPHVHFGLSWPSPRGSWWIRRGEVSPAPFLDAWRAGRDLSPAAAVAQRRKARGGNQAPCTATC